MAESATSTALVIAGRYLASPAALRARPEGPIDALDTRSGRTAQVRILFASDGWDDDAFTDAVSRWCALACSEICGVLDFGEHEGRRFLVVPPSLGMSIQRWQVTRRPGPADAARLALSFGRLAERIAAAGFPVDACDLSDCAVGPGPTPFLERPLLGSPLVNPVLVGPRDGQRTLAAIMRAAIADALPEPLADWLERASRADFETLAECLDELELRGSQARSSDADTEVVGLDGLFDDDEAYEAALLAPQPRRWPRRLLGGGAALALAVLAVAALGHRASGAPVVVTRPSPPRPVATAPTAVIERPAHHRHQRPHHVRHARPRPRARSDGGAVTTAPRPPAATTAPAATGSSGTPLPTPGAVSTLPAP
jgi:hypothetical protein